MLISAENPAVWEKEVLPWAEVAAKAGDKRIACSLDSYLRLDVESSASNRGETKDSQRQHDSSIKKWVIAPTFENNHPLSLTMHGPV